MEGSLQLLLSHTCTGCMCSMSLIWETVKIVLQKGMPFLDLTIHTADDVHVHGVFVAPVVLAILDNAFG